MAIMGPKITAFGDRVFNFVIFVMHQKRMKLEKSLRYVRINSRTVVGIRSDMSNDLVRKKFNDNLKLSPYFNPKKFFVISKSRWI